jgi:rare lipoprotein A
MFHKNPFFMKKALLSGLLLTFVSVASFAQTLIGYQQKGRASYYAAKFQGRRTASGESFNNQELTAAHRTLPFNTLLKITNTSNGKEVVVRVNDRGPFSPNRILDISKAAADQLDMVRAGVATVAVEVVGVDGMVATLPTAQNTNSPATKPLQARPLTAQPVALTAHFATLPGRKPADDTFVAGNSYSLWGTAKKLDGFGVQVASYENLNNAKDLCRELIAKKQEAVFIRVEPSRGGKLYRVLAGTFRGRRDAQQYLGQLEQIGFDGIICRYGR